jgi:hypothetical protein
VRDTQKGQLQTTITSGTDTERLVFVRDKINCSSHRVRASGVSLVLGVLLRPDGPSRLGPSKTTNEDDSAWDFCVDSGSCICESAVVVARYCSPIHVQNEMYVLPDSHQDSHHSLNRSICGYVRRVTSL